MRHRLITLAALLLTAALLYFTPEGLRTPQPEEEGVSVMVIWVNEKEKAVDRWLKKCAAAYEKETGIRVYLRSATDDETRAALEGGNEIVPPDLMIAPGAGETVCLRGFALIVRDESAVSVTPAPTSALFIRPTPVPEQEAAPSAPAYDAELLRGALAIAEMNAVCPETSPCADPAADFAAGKNAAALLTAGQAAELSFGYRAYALPEGRGFLAVEAAALSERGKPFLSYLRQREAQARLAECGLYSWDPEVSLYGPEDPLRRLIESGRSFPPGID